MALPPDITPEQRAAALAKAAASRQERAAVKNKVRTGGMSVAEVIEEGKKNEVVGKMKVIYLLTSHPGLGEVRATQMMERLGIAMSRRVQGLGPKQVAALVEEFARR